MTEIEDIKRCFFSTKMVYPIVSLQQKYLAAVEWLRTKSKRGWVLDRRDK